MAIAVPQKFYIKSFILGWSPLSDFKDKSGQIYNNFSFSSHAFWKVFVLFFVLIRNICLIPHPLILLNPSSCFLTNLLVNLKAVHLFSPRTEAWVVMHPDPGITGCETAESRFHGCQKHHSSDHLSKQLCSLAEAFLATSWWWEPTETRASKFIAIYSWNALLFLSLSKYWRIFLKRLFVKQEYEETWGSRV